LKFIIQLLFFGLTEKMVALHGDLGAKLTGTAVQDENYRFRSLENSHESPEGRIIPGWKIAKSCIICIYIYINIICMYIYIIIIIT